MIEDITFNPVDRDVLVSVGDDKLIIGWDLRINTSKTFVVNKNINTFSFYNFFF